MLRLYMNGTEADLYQDESVNLTLQFSDVQNINGAAGSYSQTFRIPATPNNLGILGNLVSPSAVGVDLKTKISAELVANSVPILRGYCQVKKVYLQKERYADIEVVFFAGATDLKTAIGDGMLTDLDLSAYDHTLNQTNIVDSWTGATGIAPEIRYGLIDKGFNWSFPSNPPWTESDGLYQGELTPFIQVKKVFDAIMDEAGFTYDSSFFDATGTGNMSEMYLLAYNGSPTPIPDENSLSRCRVALDADFTGSSLTTLDLVDTATNAIDEGSNWSNINHRYTAPFTGSYGIVLIFSYDQSPHLSHVDIEIHINGSEVLDADAYTTTQTAAYNSYIALQNYTLASGDTVEVKGKVEGGHGHAIFGNDVCNEGIRTELYIEGWPYSGQDIDMAANMPKMKQIDFVLGLQKMFNLVFVQDKNKPNHLLIEPFMDYVGTGTAKDWSDRVDYSKDVTLAPTTDLQAKEYKWTYKPGTDFISDAVQKSLDRVYGEYEVTDPSNDFATGEKTVETTFGQYMTSLIPGSGFPIHRSLKADGTAIKDPLPMVAYWHGTSDNYGDWYIRNDSGTTVGPSSFFPSFSNYSEDSPTITHEDLNFGMEQPFFPINIPPWRTLYFQYWAQYVKELYSEEARIMTCTMRLSQADITGFEFSDRIYLKDSYWRVQKLSYDANVEGVCQVELIKELSDVAICDDTPTGFDDRYNFILFNSSTSGTPDFGSQACCELYGYEWVTIAVGVPGGTSPMGICKPKPQATQPS
jgi:hypothetical protein